MKKTYQTYHAEHGSEHGESRVGDVGFISHGQEDHTAIKLPLKPTYLKKKIFLENTFTFNGSK